MYYYGNSPLFFVPSYPDEEIRHTKDEGKLDHKEKALFPVDEALEKGNAFRDEYKGYKNYVPVKLTAKKEQDILMLNIQAFTSAAHDLALYLDIYPGDKRLLDKFMEYAKKANELIEEYQQKFETLTPSKAKDKNGTFSYVLTPSVWLKLN